MMPTPPGVSGMAVSSRAKANAARTWAQPTSASDTPMTRSVMSRTAYSDRCPRTGLMVSPAQRWRTSPMTRPRNFVTAWSHPCTGPLRTTLRRADIQALAEQPGRRAKSSLRRMSANTTTAPTSPTRPNSAATIRPPPGSPCTARMARATIGMPSLAKLFQMPVTSTDSVDRDFEKPHDDSIE